jgi:4-diphosphocytidyl-2-C-methyl-D-erythritol kinase
MTRCEEANRFRVRAPGKVNLSLFVGPVREDGRHEVVTLLESVSLADELLACTLTRPPDVVHCEAIGQSNLASVAIERLRSRGWEGPPVEVEIAKRIPVAGGMGGGSADAAAILRLAHRLRAVPDHDLVTVAAELGADVPSQLAPGLVLGTAAGERVSLRQPLGPHAFVIVPQPHELLSREVYAEADRLGLARDHAELQHKRDQLEAALSPGGRLGASLLVNDLEPAATSLLPPVADAIEAVRETGAEHALVSGSGPTVFGLFWGEDGVQRADRSAADLRDRFPEVNPAVPVDAEFGRPVPSA